MAAPIPPPPGSAAPGELYVDLQSRSLWLGVGAAVDPNLAVLISDIEGIAEDDAATLAAANAYTNAQVATRAPMAHTHLAAQITDFNAAVDARIIASPDTAALPPRTIVMWSGSLAEIGVGALAGWALCDGGNSTPNLRDKFIIGAGNKPVGATNPGTNLTLSGGTHVHTINQTVLSVAEMPSHNHGGITGTESANHTHRVTGVTDAQGVHAHGISTNNNTSAGRKGVRAGDSGPSGVTQNTELAGNHQHNFDVWTGGASANHQHDIPAQGGGQGHTHTIVGGGGIHSHDITPAQIRDTAPYYALAYIMKL